MQQLRLYLTWRAVGHSDEKHRLLGSLPHGILVGEYWGMGEVSKNKTRKDSDRIHHLKITRQMKTWGKYSRHILQKVSLLDA